MITPVAWYGGKQNLSKYIIKIMPEHRTYVEVFGGGAAVLFAKPPSPVEIYNDIDSGLVNFFRVLRDPEKYKKLQELLELTPYSREEFYYCRDTWKDVDDEIERARRWYYVAASSFSGVWGVSWKHSAQTNMAKRYYNKISAFDKFHQRIKNVQIENLDFRDLIPKYDTKDTLFYLDPPYMQTTRRRPNEGYVHEMSINDHKDLVKILLKIKGKAILSGYKTGLYKKLEDNGWHRIDIKTKLTAHLSKRKDEVTESLWINYDLREVKKQNLISHYIRSDE